MKRPPRPLRRVIAEDATLAAWQARRAREEALLAVIGRVLPRQVAARLRAVESAEGEIELLAPAGAIAAAVRQRTPELAQALQREGWSCRALRVRVQVSVDAAVPTTKRAPPAVNRQDLAPLAELGRELPAGPLKSAVARLLRRTGGG